VLITDEKLKALWAVYYTALGLTDKAEVGLEGDYAYDLLQPYVSQA